jgi:hypothetical protein
MASLWEAKPKAFKLGMWGVEAFTLACWVAGGIGLAWGTSQGVGRAAEHVQAALLIIGAVLLAIAAGTFVGKRGGVRI